jgi:Zinc-binding dehydrogenase
VGLACAELARLRDTRVIAAVGSETKANVVRDHGADAVIDYSSEDLRERVKAITGGEGGDVCVDNVGGKLFATLARLMRWNGRLLPVGFTSGEVPSIPMNLPLLKNYSIVGMFSGAWTNRCPEEVECAMQAIMQSASNGDWRFREPAAHFAHSVEVLRSDRRNRWPVRERSGDSEISGDGRAGSPGIAALGRRYSPCVPELNDVTIVLLRIEIIVLVFVEAAALDHGIAAAGEIGDGLLAVFVVKLDVMEPLATLLEMLVVDAVAGQRLHELKLRVSAPRDGD